MVPDLNKQTMTTVVAVLPSTTYRANDFVGAAESLGVDLIVASEQPPPFEMGDRYVQIDCSDPDSAAEAIVKLGDRTAIDGIIGADDSGVVVTALAATELGLRGNDPDAARATRNKALMRTLLAKAEVAQPRFGIVEPGESAAKVASSVGYPLVIKPVDRSAGQGVTKVVHHLDLGLAIARLQGIIGHGEQVLIEEFMPGVEVAVEGVVRGGQLTTLAIFDKPDAAQGPYFPETILVTPSVLDTETQNECERVAQAALRGLDITHGPVHVELKVSGREARIIEVAARSIGGLCSKSLTFGLLGTTLESLIIRNALGWDKPELRRERSASGVLMIPIPQAGTFERIAGLDSVKELDGISSIDITARPGSRVVPAPEGDHYLGFVFARGTEPGQVTDALRKASELIQVELR